ncbi:MAG: adenylate cyclase [Paracoccaceae bacterium]|jgi:adenylate cyclase
MTQQLTTELARFRDLWVLPLGAIEPVQGGSLNYLALAKNFGAQYALEGSVQDGGATLHLSARLVNLKSGRYIWVRSYDIDQTPAKIYEAQDAIIKDVVGKLAGKYGILTQGAMGIAKRKAPNHLDAYDCVLRYYDYQMAIRLKDHAEIKACLMRATQIDPEYAEAWAVLSNLYMQTIRFDLSGDKIQALLQATTAVEHALSLDPESFTAHLMQANILFNMGDIEGFVAAGETALALNPNSNVVLAHYGMRLAFSGSWDEGLALVEHAKMLNPVHPQWYFLPEVFYQYSQKNYTGALAVLDEIQMPDFFWTQLLSAASHGQLGNRQQAGVHLKTLLELKPNFASIASEVIETWHLDDAFNRDLEQGLKNAGLDISAET